MIRVMIVDDEPSARARYADYVSGSDAGFLVVATCANGADALENLREARPQVVLTDIRMPGMSGLEMVEQMRRAGWDGHAVVISGYDDFEFAREALRLQMVDYLLKPIFPDDMHQMLEKIRERGFARLQQSGIRSVVSVDPRSLPLFLRRALEFVENHYDSHLSLAEVARVACVSPTYLSRAFSHHCGASFVDVCHRVRVLAAQELLRDSGRTLADVAEQVGLTDASHLTRVFRKITGETPGAYRSQAARAKSSS